MITQSLINRFKEFNRVKKRGSNVTVATFASSKDSSKSINEIDEPSIPEGEDSLSFERHNTRIKMELKKSNVNKVVINELIDRTYAFRRRDIVKDSGDLSTIFNKYPFLKDTEQV